MRHARYEVVVLLSLILAGTTLASQPSTITRRVQRVIDGDTLVVAGVGTVRLIGVDTPEMGDPRQPVQFYALEASTFTTKMVGGQTVTLQFEGAEKDRYGRTLAYVYLLDGTLLNAELIRQGFAHTYTSRPFQKMEDFRALQREAMSQNRGLWAHTTARDEQPPATQPLLAVEKTATLPDSADVTVYVTRTGAKYHRAGCRFLARSQIPLTLTKASERYGPCAVCRPPDVLEVKPTATPERPLTSAPSPPTGSSTSVSGRCQAITKKGTQCSRNAKPGTAFCWQHGG